MAEQPSLADVVAMVARWQRRLELQDWHVEVKLARGREIGGEYRAGRCDYILTERWAKILIREPGDMPTDAVAPEDIERTVIHELLHLHAAPFAADGDTPADTAQEQAINALARAFVSLARGVERYRPPTGADDGD